MIKKIIILFACGIFFAGAAHAQHQLGIELNGGLQGLQYSVQDGSNKLLPGGGLSLQYSIPLSKHFNLLTGVGAGYYGNKTTLNDGAVISTPLVDDVGAAFLFNVKGKGYLETHRFIAANVPLMLQYHTLGKTQWYLNAGGKFLLPFTDKIKSSAQQLALSGFYPDYNITIDDLPQHGFGIADQFAGNATYKLRSTVAVSAATGVSFRLAPRVNLYTGVYADYGLTDMRNTDNASLSLPLVTYNPKGIDDVQGGTILNSSNAGNARLLAFGIQAGLKFDLTKKREPKPKAIDSDADGITDDKDKCPMVYGLAKYEGCPVPDSDGDGVNDEEDKCPTVSGSAKYQGCPIPDSDGDGINDEQDKCPTVPGVSKYLGCPIPDVDGDGVDDKDDKCPKVAGPEWNFGCPEIGEETIVKVQRAARNIYFQTNKAILLPKSMKEIDNVVEIMKADTLLIVDIKGNTDNVGGEGFNMGLSQRRADAVKVYMIGKGIPESHLTSIGYGFLRPIAPNTTPEGRQLNRRVEMVLRNY